MFAIRPLERSKSNVETERCRRLLNFMHNFHYDMNQSNGQRVTIPRGITLSEPERGSEIFIGKIPRNVYEDELIPLFERVGPIYKFRLMLDFCGLNRGYGFVTYTNANDANRAIAIMDHYEIRCNRYIGVYKSIDNCRLFMGGVPVDKTKNDIFNALNDYVDGIKELIMYPAQNAGDVNRGYVFIEFIDHKAAAMARRQLGSGFVLWERDVAVDWADPIPEVSPDIMKQVTKLYIRNLPLNMDEFFVRKALNTIIDDLAITKVHKIKDYAFIHFKNRESAEYVLEILKQSDIFGGNIEVDWARPARFSKYQRMNAPAQNFCTSVPPRMRKIVQERKTAMTQESRSVIPAMDYISKGSSTLTISSGSSEERTFQLWASDLIDAALFPYKN